MDCLFQQNNNIILTTYPTTSQKMEHVVSTENMDRSYTNPR